MAVRTKRLFGVVNVGTSLTTLYVCPVDETAIIKSIFGFNSSALANTVVFYLTGSANSSRFYTFTVPGNGGFLERDLFLVLQPGELLRATATSSGVQMVGSGTELEGVAD